MQQTHNTLPEATRQKSVELLNLNLAGAIDLHAQIKMAHWNVRGRSFWAVHELFDKVATSVLEMSDELAERCGGLGGTAQGTIQVAVKNSQLVPYPHQIASIEDHIFAVASGLAAFSQMMREAIDVTDEAGDKATADLFTQLVREIDENLYFVESHREPHKN
jgi:starvation-inducible DNA-binding protein